MEEENNDDKEMKIEKKVLILGFMIGTLIGGYIFLTIWCLQNIK